MGSWQDMADRVITTDVLIIGSEGAGGTAAVSARKRNLKVTVATKGSDIRRSGASVTGDGAIAFDSVTLKRHGITGARDDDSPDLFFSDIVRGGKYLNNQKMVEAHVSDAPARFEMLKEWGVPFTYCGHASGHSAPRSAFIPGPKLMPPIRNAVLQSGAEMVTNIMITDLLTQGNRVVGAVGLDMEAGGFVIIQARAVVNCTGGAMRIYPYTSAPEELTGDGMAMSYRAGAELINMEFPMFIPGGFIWPEAVKGIDLPFLISASGARMQGAMLNCWGDRFMRHWDSDKLERTTRDIVSVAMMLEVRQGRGSEHGGIYVTFAGLPKTIVDRWEKIIPPELYFGYGGFDMKKILPDLRQDAVEAAPVCHFWNGGVRINERCETSLAGYYAAGEVTGGLHGANRIGDNAYTEMVVWGTRSGSFASEYAAGADFGQVDASQVAALKQRVYRPLENEGGPSPVEARKQLQTLAWEKVGVLRTGPELEEALKTLAEWREERVPTITARAKHRSWNRDWFFALEYENMVQTLQMVATAALERTESRGSNYRLDYPMTDNDHWLRNLVLKQEDSRLKLWAEPIVVTKYQPPAGVFPYGKLEPQTAGK